MVAKAMSETPVIDAVRAATSEDHDRLERRMDILNRLSEPALRRDMMVRFYGVHAMTRPALAVHLADVDGLDFDGRDKLAVLAEDLAALGARPEDALACPPPDFASAAEAMGFQYVLEGSTLGGRVIHKDAARRGLGLEGLRFFDVYGGETGNRWRDFRVVMERECASDIDAAVRGAKRGFQLVEMRLCDDAPPGHEKAAE